MARGIQLSPGERAELLATKLAPADAERVVELANQAGVSKSEYLRSVVLDRLEREDEQ